MAVAESFPHASTMEKMRIADEILKHICRNSVLRLKNHALDSVSLFWMNSMDTVSWKVEVDLEYRLF